MPDRCLLCGTAGAMCGTPTVYTVLPVDQRVTGFKVAGDTVVPVNAGNLSMVLGDMTDDEREEFRVLMEAQRGRSLRNAMRERMATAMAEGKAPHTSLSYVQGPDGIIRKMDPDVARKYVELNEGSEIVREGALPVAKEGEVLGATKATVGQMFDADGKQIPDVQPITTRTFLAEQSVREEVRTPEISGANPQRGDIVEPMTPSGTTATETEPTTGTTRTARRPAGSNE